jgi:hypothetical protein
MQLAVDVSVIFFFSVKNLACTSKRTPPFTITAINLLMLFKEITPVQAENHTKLTNTKCSVVDW